MDAAEGMSNRLVWFCIVVLVGSLVSYPQSTAPTELSSSAVLFSDDGGGQTDDCPEVNGTSSIDRNGCLDTDGDGKLSDTEKKTLRAEMQNRPGGHDRKQWTPEQRNEMLKKFDKDGDGKLSDTEKASLRSEMQVDVEVVTESNGLLSNVTRCLKSLIKTEMVN